MASLGDLVMRRAAWQFLVQLLYLQCAFLGVNARRSEAERERDREMGPGNGTVQTLTEENWSRHMGRDEAMMVIYHVPWCGLCQRTFPIFLEACTKAKKMRIDARCGHVDCAWDKHMCFRYDVKEYPAFLIFAEGESIKRPRRANHLRYTVDGFIDYMKRMVKTPIYHLTRDLHKKQRLDDYINSKNETMAIFVIIIPDRAETPVGAQAAADAYRDRHGFYAVPDLAMAFGYDSPLLEVTMGATFISFSSSRQQWAPAGKAAHPAVSAFMHSVSHNVTTPLWAGENRFPGIWRLNDVLLWEDFVNAGRKCVVAAVHPEHDNEDVERALHHAHESLKDDFYFGVLDGLEWEQTLKTYNVYVDDLPRVFIMDQGFDAWIEDVEQLRVSHLESDLRRILAGAPVIGGGRSMARKVGFHRREVKRQFLKTLVYAKEGPKEAMMVLLAAIVALGASGIVMYIAYMIFRDTLLVESEGHSKKD